MTTSEKRNLLGFAGWFLLSVLLPILTWPVMYFREVWQSKHGGFALEYDDIWWYTVAIILGSTIGILVYFLVIL